MINCCCDRAFFGQVRRRGAAFKPVADETIYLDPRGEVEHLRTGKVMQPKLLGSDFVKAEKKAYAATTVVDLRTLFETPYGIR